MSGAAAELLIMRHGKSDWDSDAADFFRPLSSRGRSDAARMAEWLAARDSRPDFVLTSAAVRAADTARLVIERFDLPTARVEVADELYLANAWTWLSALEQRPPERILLCGHNPGLDDLVEYLSADPLPLSASGKLMTTAAIAHFAFDEDWSGIGRGSGHLLALARPREL